MNLLACNNCGWVHVGRTPDEVLEEVRRFNEWYDLAPVEHREMYGERASAERYKWCSHCSGPHTDFRPAVDGDCPVGCTIQPILMEST